MQVFPFSPTIPLLRGQHSLATPTDKTLQAEKRESETETETEGKQAQKKPFI